MHASELAARNLPVRVYPHPDEPEALYWECEGAFIPCGGTHLASTGAVGRLEVRRRIEAMVDAELNHQLGSVSMAAARASC